MAKPRTLANTVTAEVIGANSTTVTAYVSASATPAVIGYQVVEFY